VMSGFEYSEKSKLLIPNQLGSPETFNDVIVDNVLRFPMAIHKPQSDWRVMISESCHLRLEFPTSTE
jgi:hypothetical protein